MITAASKSHTLINAVLGLCIRYELATSCTCSTRSSPVLIHMLSCCPPKLFFFFFRLTLSSPPGFLFFGRFIWSKVTRKGLVHPSFQTRLQRLIFFIAIGLSTLSYFAGFCQIPGTHPLALPPQKKNKLQIVFFPPLNPELP